MNKDIIKGKLNQLNGRLKATWADLTDDDIGRVKADLDQLIGQLQERYGRVRQEASDEMHNWERQYLEPKFANQPFQWPQAQARSPDAAPRQPRMGEGRGDAPRQQEQFQPQKQQAPGAHHPSVKDAPVASTKRREEPPSKLSDTEQKDRLLNEGGATQPGQEPRDADSKEASRHSPRRPQQG